MPPRVVDPDTISPQERREIERKQFQPLEGEDLEWFLAQQKIIDECDLAEENPVFNPQDEGIEEEHEGTPKFDRIALAEIATRGPLTYRDLGTIINKAKEVKLFERAVNRTRPLDAYVRMICTYVNKWRGLQLREQRKNETVALEKTRKEKEREEIDESRGPPPKKIKVTEEAGGADMPALEPALTVVEAEIGENGPSCAMIPSKQFDTLRYKSDKKTQEAAKKMLVEMELTGSKFTELDFLFIPWVLRPEGGNNVLNAHAVLLGVAPKQKFAFVIDGMDPNLPQQNPDEEGTYDLSHNIMRMLVLSELKLTEFTQDNKETYKDEWRLYGQWASRSRTTDDSPNGPQQSDYYNCGIFATTTAFCLAFGYDLNCWKQADLEAYKKHRMAVELRNGEFSGDYEYDLLKLPTIRGQSGALPRNIKRPPPPPQTSSSEPDTSDSQASQPGAETEHDEEEDDEEEEVVVEEKEAESEVSDHEHLDGGIEVSDTEQEVPQYRYEYIDPDNTEEEGSDGEDDDFETRTGLKRKFLYTKKNLEAAMKWTPKLGPKVKDYMPFPAQFDEIFHRQCVVSNPLFWR